MTATTINEIGTLYLASAGDDLSGIDLGGNVKMCSAYRRYAGVCLGRSYYLQGDGMLTFTDDEIERSYDLCAEYLRSQGYTTTDWPLQEFWTR